MGERRFRAGRYVQQPAGYRAFVPVPLPPDPPLRLDAPLVTLISRADQAIGRLDGIARIVSNPDLFVTMYVRREAVLSSRIEGTQSSLDDVLVREIDPAMHGLPRDVVEVANNVRALQYGLQRLQELPLSLRLIRELHAELMQGAHGVGKQPGEFRTSQNWIGTPGAALTDAAYVPPAPADMWTSLDNFERFLHAREGLPALVHCAVAHAQFEMIHPFLDGNGRVGRLVITLLLYDRGVLRHPLLYLSDYLNAHRPQYYARLTAIHDEGDWEGWIQFFVEGVLATAERATTTVLAILELHAAHQQLVRSHSTSVNAVRLLDLLYQQPIVDAKLVKARLGVSFQTASSLLQRFVALDLLDEITGGRRARKFRYTPYLRLFGPETRRTSNSATSSSIAATSAP
jgi:Fic family protein